MTNKLKVIKRITAILNITIILLTLYNIIYSIKTVEYVNPLWYVAFALASLSVVIGNFAHDEIEK